MMRMEATVLMDALGRFLTVYFTPLIWIGATLVSLRVMARRKPVGWLVAFALIMTVTSVVNGMIPWAMTLTNGNLPNWFPVLGAASWCLFSIAPVAFVIGLIIATRDRKGSQQAVPE